MRRREFITLFGGTVVAWQHLAQAEQRRLVGVLWNDRSAVENFGFDAALRSGLAEAGFTESSNIAFAERYAGSDLARIAGELSALKPDVIIASGSRNALEVHRAAPEVPVVGASGAGACLHHKRDILIYQAVPFFSTRAKDWLQNNKRSSAR